MKQDVEARFYSIWKELGFHFGYGYSKNGVVYIYLNKNVDKNINRDIVDYFYKKLPGTISCSLDLLNDCIVCTTVKDKSKIIKDLEVLEKML